MKSNIILIEIETAIRDVSCISVQVGQKSLQTITVDFNNEIVKSKYSTGTTKMGIITVGSIRNDFNIKRYRFNSGVAYFPVSGQTASAVGFMPNINYQFDFEVSKSAVKFKGSHDGYPSYNIAINKKSAYDYTQGHIGQLFGTSDTKVYSKTFLIK